MRCIGNRLMHAFFYNASSRSTSEDDANNMASLHTTKWKYQQQFQIPLRVAISVFLLITNTLNIIGIKATNKYLSLPRKLFVLSSFLGIMAGTVSPINSCIGLFTENCLNEVLTDSILVFLLSADFAILLVINLVRFFTLKAPLKRLNRVLVGIMLAVGFSISIVFGALFYYLYHGTIHPSYYYRMHWFCLGMFTTLCMVSCLILMVLLWYMLRRRIKHFPQNNTVFIQQHKRSVKRLISINLLYICFNFPISTMCFNLVNITGDAATQNQLSNELLILSAFYSFCLIYSGVSCIVYMCWDTKILVFYKNFLCKMRTVPNV